MMLKFIKDIPSVKIIDVDGIGIKKGNLKRNVINYTYYGPETESPSDINQKDDIYIMGWLILQMFASYIGYDISLLRPQDHQVNISQDTIENILNRYFSLGKLQSNPKLKQIKNKIKKLILNMMIKNKNERWSMRKIKKHMKKCIEFIDEGKELI